MPGRRVWFLGVGTQSWPEPRPLPEAGISLSAGRRGGRETCREYSEPRPPSPARRELGGEKARTAAANQASAETEPEPSFCSRGGGSVLRAPAGRCLRTDPCLSDQTSVWGQQRGPETGSLTTGAWGRRAENGLRSVIHKTHQKQPLRPTSSLPVAPVLELLTQHRRLPGAGLPGQSRDTTPAPLRLLPGVGSGSGACRSPDGEGRTGRGLVHSRRTARTRDTEA